MLKKTLRVKTVSVDLENLEVKRNENLTFTEN